MWTTNKGEFMRPRKSPYLSAFVPSATYNRQNYNIDKYKRKI